jgi:glutaredoxin
METICKVSLAALLVLVLLLVVKLNSVKVYRFYRPSCPHCVSSQKAWDKFKQACLFKLITPVDVNMDSATDREMKLAENFGVESVPSVFKVCLDGYREKHEGDRTLDGYLNFAEDT